MESQETLRKGDRVRLHDGGPRMHVVAVSENLCYCNWVDDQGRIQQGTFERRALERADPAESRPATLLGGPD